MDNLEAFITDTIEEAGKATMEMFGKARVLYSKFDVNDVVTEADLASNEIITRAITVRFPDHAIISEEGENAEAREFTWYIDPLDGTKNFSTHIPLYGVIIALAKSGVITHGAIYLPFFKEMLYAEKGKGAWLNGEKIVGSNASSLEFSYGLMSAIINDEAMDMTQHLHHAADRNLLINNLGCMAVGAVFLASGRRDWGISLFGSSWDYAAAALAYEEVGYKITDVQGNPWSLDCKEMVAANPVLHEKIMKAIKK